MHAFVATSLKNVPEALNITAMLEQQGFSHQCCITEIGHLKDGELFEHNVQGIRDADVFITIYKNLGRDTSTEVGMAYAWGKRRIAVSYGGDSYAADTMVNYAVGDIVTEAELPSVLDRLKQEAKREFLEFYVPRIGVSAAHVTHQLAAVLESQRLVDSRYVGELERRLGERYGRNVVATGNGTAGLIVALDSILTNPDKREVIVPSLTFPATAQAILHAGGIPVYADVDKETWTLDPRDVERRITEKTGALLPVSLFGTPCDVDTFKEISESMGIPLLYDSCMAFGARSRSGEVGTFGIAEVFSLDITKLVSGGLGGYVTTADEQLMEKFRRAKNFGLDEGKVLRQRGINARLLEFNAILALYSLEGVEERLSEQEQRSAKYRECFRDIERVKFQKSPDGSAPSRQMLAVEIDSAKDDIAYHVHESLKRGGIGSRIYTTKLVHRDPEFGGGDHALPVTEQIAPRLLCLPMHAHVREHHMEKIADVLKRELS